MNLPTLLQQAPPAVAVDVSPARVAVVRLAGRAGKATLAGYGVESLPAGAVSGALAGVNMPDVRVVSAAIGRALSTAGARPGRVCLVVPDSIARVSIVKFEAVPDRAADLDELIRWQIKKTTPFPLADAVVSHTAGASGQGGHEFVVTVARRDVVAQFEQACDAAGCHAGVVDLSTFNVANAVLASGRSAAGDWLLVHAASTYVSLALLRDGRLIFYRTRGEESEGSIADLVHQTAMYYEDRLQGQRFTRVLLSGGATATDVDYLRQELSERLAIEVSAVDPFRAAAPVERGGMSPVLADTLAPGIGILLRDGKAA